MIKLLRLHGWPIFRQLQLEEAILRTDRHNWCLLNEGSSPAVVMGLSAKPAEVINFDRLANLPLIKRFSGGGTVVVDPDTLFVTFICNHDEMQVPGRPDKIHAWATEIYRPLFSRLPFAFKDNDYVLGNRKFGGNAQYICKDRWLHHTSLLWDYDQKLMSVLRQPKKQPKYREDRHHDEFLCKLGQFFDCRQAWKQSLVESLSSRFGIVEVQESEVEDWLTREHRKTTHYWVYTQTNS